MDDCQRASPIIFEATAEDTELRNGWGVVLAYRGEGNGPALVDLSHCAKWDVQDKNLSELRPSGLKIPGSPGTCLVTGGVIVSRLNSTQASIWQFSKRILAWPDLSCLTEMTDAHALMALIGRETTGIIEKVSALDLTPLDKEPPFLLLGQVLQIPMQLVVMDGEKRPSGILLACSRGYAQCVVRALLDAGSEFGLKPAGEKHFVDWMRNLSAV
jgi:hypothetical protein